jgi:hypothetical protein
MYQPMIDKKFFFSIKKNIIRENKRNVNNRKLFEVLPHIPAARNREAQNKFAGEGTICLTPFCPFKSVNRKNG